MGQPVTTLCSVPPSVFTAAANLHGKHLWNCKAGMDKCITEACLIAEREHHIYRIEFFHCDIHHLHVKMPSDFLPHKPSVMFSCFPVVVILVWI